MTAAENRSSQRVFGLVSVVQELTKEISYFSRILGRIANDHYFNFEIQFEFFDFGFREVKIQKHAALNQLKTLRGVAMELHGVTVGFEKSQRILRFFSRKMCNSVATPLQLFATLLQLRANPL